ncbi:MAG: PCMD domain-containing protein, partial [Bacteroidales bacterium]|nr:PCMD domain-containing protein [Bacteroidales bacterium]
MKRIASIFLVAAFVCSCIVNDIPYPRVQANITAYRLEGQVQDSKIDNKTRTISITMPDVVDLRSAHITEFAYNDSLARLVSPFNSVEDLTLPVSYRFETYPGQTYEWTVTATSDIKRTFTVANQVENAMFNLEYKTVVVFVDSKQSIRDITVLDAVFARSNETVEPDPKSVKDYSTIRSFKVSYFDVVETWQVQVIQKDAQLMTNTPDPWGRFAYVSGVYANSLGNPCFKYRKTTESEWKVFDSNLEIDGNNVYGRITGLEEDTEYEYMMATDKNDGPVVRFTTDKTPQMPNMSFEEWHKPDKSWYPNSSQEPGQWYETGKAWWDTGNPGSNVFGEANPTIPDEEFSVKGKAVRMKTQKVAGIIAGGNVFSGQFVRTSGVGALVNFGRSFPFRPTQLKGYYCYDPKVVTVSKPGFEWVKGRNDRCHIFVYLAEWPLDMA